MTEETLQFKGITKLPSPDAKARKTEQGDDDEILMESVRNLVFGNKGSPSSRSNDLERHHVVLKVQGFPTLGTRIFRKVRKLFRYSQLIDVEDLVRTQNFYLQREHGRLFPNGKVPSVCFWVRHEKSLAKPEWLDPENPDEMRYCDKNIAYVRASEECLRHSMRNRNRRKPKKNRDKTSAAEDETAPSLATQQEVVVREATLEVAARDPALAPAPVIASVDSTAAIDVPPKLFQLEASRETDTRLVHERLTSIITEWIARSPGYAERVIKEKLIHQFWEDLNKYEEFLKQNPLVPAPNLSDDHALYRQSVHSSLLVDIANSIGNAMVDWYNCQLLRVNANAAPYIPLLPPGNPPDSSPPGSGSPPSSGDDGPRNNAPGGFDSFYDIGGFGTFETSQSGGQEERGIRLENANALESNLNAVEAQSSDRTDESIEIPTRTNSHLPPEENDPQASTQSKLPSMFRPSSSSKLRKNDTELNDFVAHRLCQINNAGVAAFEAGNLDSAISFFRDALNVLKSHIAGSNTVSDEAQCQTVPSDAKRASLSRPPYKKPNSTSLQNSELDLDETFFVYTTAKMLHASDITGTATDFESKCASVVLFNTALAQHQKGLLANSKALIQARRFYDASLSMMDQMSSHSGMHDILVAAINNKAHIDFECGNLCGARTTMYDLLMTICGSNIRNSSTQPPLEDLLYKIMHDKDWQSPIDSQEVERYIMNTRFVNSTYTARPA